MENPHLVDIPEYEGLYKFDLELNKVYNCKTNIYLKNSLNGKGYYDVCLSKNKIRNHFRVNRLVYICNNPTEDITEFQIDHKDGNRQNNNIHNLRKATSSENCSNRKTPITNRLGIKYISKTTTGYKFQLRKNKINYYKHFKNLEDAITYRDIKVREICGEFANLG